MAVFGFIIHIPHQGLQVAFEQACSQCYDGKSEIHEVHPVARHCQQAVSQEHDYDPEYYGFPVS